MSGDLADPGLLADVALAAEQAGWDGVFVWDHLWNRTLVPFADPFVTLAAIAMATERVVIGTMVTALPRRRPQLVAQSTTSVDRLSSGRMVLGLGLGVDSYGEYSVFDEPAVDDRARAAALDAGIGLLAQMLAGVPVAGAGGRVTTPASVQRPRVPIWIAGRAGLSAGPRPCAVTDWKVSHWWMPNPGRPNMSRPRCLPGIWPPARSTSRWLAARIPIQRRWAQPARRGAFPEILPGATAAEALAMAATPPG